MHLSATLRAHATSGALRHRASSICIADRFEPSGCCVSQGGTTDHTSCCKKNRSRLAPAVQHPARSLIIVVIDQVGVLGQPHRRILCVWSALIFMTFYLWLLGKIPYHTDHIYDLRYSRQCCIRLRHVEPARVPLRHAAPSPPQALDSLHRLVKAQSRRPPDFLPGHASQDGK